MNATHVVTRRTWRFRSPPTFFGLSSEYIQQVYEEFFLLKYHGGWSFIEAYNLPVVIRRWFLERLADQIKKESDQLLAFDEELKDLLATWFDVGFLTLERITWDAPATLLEMLAEHEAVHSIRSWQDIKHRLAAPDRRCFAFTHEQMPHQPLIFVWVALTDGIADQIDNLLKIDQQELDPNKADTAVFYSISAREIDVMRSTSFANSFSRSGGTSDISNP